MGPIIVGRVPMTSPEDAEFRCSNLKRFLADLKSNLENRDQPEERFSPLLNDLRDRATRLEVTGRRTTIFLWFLSALLFFNVYAGSESIGEIKIFGIVPNITELVLIISSFVFFYFIDLNLQFKTTDDYINIAVECILANDPTSLAAVRYQNPGTFMGYHLATRRGVEYKSKLGLRFLGILPFIQLQITTTGSVIFYLFCAISAIVFILNNSQLNDWILYSIIALSLAGIGAGVSTLLLAIYPFKFQRGVGA